MGYATPRPAAAPRTFETTCSKANSGVWTPTTTNPASRYARYQPSTCGSERWQLMQEYVQKSTRTTLPLSWARVSGRLPGVLSQATMPVNGGAVPRSGRAAAAVLAASDCFFANVLECSPLSPCNLAVIDDVPSMRFSS